MKPTPEDSMRQWILESPGQISLQTVPRPIPQTGDLLIKVSAATTCGTDLKAYLRGHPQIPMPGGFGHEWSGVVEQVGKGAKFQPGDSVFGVHTAPCFRCFWCQRGQENLCETIMQTKVMGAFASHLLIPKRIADVHVFLKPPELPSEVACLIEPLACVMEGVNQLAPNPNDNIAIIGPGAIGILFGIALQQLGIQHITLFGRSPERLQQAKAMGIATASTADLARSEYDAVIECTGTKEVWEASVSFARRGGTVMLFGGLPSGTKASFDAGLVHYSQVKILSPFHFGSSAVKAAKALIEKNPSSFLPLLSGRVDLEDLPDVLQKLQARIGVKYALIP